IEAVDHVALWAGNAKQAAHYYRSAFGFAQIAYAGPETGVRDSCTYVLRQGQVTLTVSSGLSPDSPIVQFCARHGDGVRRVALRVPDCRSAFTEAVKRGAEAVEEPHFDEDRDGAAGMSAIQLYGDVVMA